MRSVRAGEQSFTSEVEGCSFKNAHWPSTNSAQLMVTVSNAIKNLKNINAIAPGGGATGEGTEGDIVTERCVCIYIDIYIYVCVCVCLYIYIYCRERERDR